MINAVFADSSSLGGTTAAHRRVTREDNIATVNFISALLARLVFEQTNAERRGAGLEEFAWSGTLARAAAGHSADMTRHDYFSHKMQGTGGRSGLVQRLAEAGIPMQACAENIFMLPVSDRYLLTAEGRYPASTVTYDEAARAVVKGWMNSRAHRRNILNKTMNALGVGCAIGTHNSVPYIYLTQNFSEGM